MSEASIRGMPDVRALAGAPNAAMERDFELSMTQQSDADFPKDADGAIRYPHLALSGGGAVGAFGAGFLEGWTETGRRPTFKIVTGVSTGALMAPFAFLGPQYDERLRRFYTQTTSREIFKPISVLTALLRRESLAQTTPLEELIRNTIDAPLLAKIAEAHRHGRRLYMGTVNLDNRRFVVWNMGLIATYQNQAALELFRRVMLASASVPIAFPPVLFQVEANGQTYDEMHVDGFVIANVFVLGSIFSPSEIYSRHGDGRGREDIFIVHNGKLTVEPSATERSLRGIALRSIEVAGWSGIVGDLFREFAFARRDNAGFHWVTIAEGTPLPESLEFNPEEMLKLYEVGREDAKAGPEWRLWPPGMRGDRNQGSPASTTR
ncbi:patatin-like phospholipase family protein [Dyella solisilvae]|uniref:Patatin-like phospholipase family protein n=2 Tax=Dyella solisilvae TaxID=1920168 RepID=A0A370K4G4_9GAMM|nr:patatin-like phospholipase family protein [Dyella solisilvae]